MNLNCLSLSFTLRDVFIHMYFISGEKSKRFHPKVNSRSFRWLPAATLVDRFDHQHGVSLQQSFKLRETLQQITHKRRTVQTWELERWFINLFPLTSQVLVFFHWTVSNLFFCCVIVKTMNTPVVYVSLGWHYFPFFFFLQHELVAFPP